MTAPTKPAPVDLGVLREKVAHLRKAQETLRNLNANVNQWKAYRESLEREIAVLMGDATVGKIDGLEVLTYERRAQFAHAQFTKDHPDLAQVFMRPGPPTMVLDWEALVAAEPGIAAPYQTRIMKVVTD